MTELTAEKIRLVALAVELMRHTGRIPFDAEVSHRRMERVSHEIGCPVSARDIARFEARAIAKARLAARALQLSKPQSPQP
jgi:phage FluMu protein gp41